MAFGIEIIREAEQIMSDALAGLTWLNKQPDVLAALQANVKCIYKALARQQGKPRLPKVKLVWPMLRPSLPEQDNEAHHHALL